MLKDFKEFIAQGNILDMAIGVVMGAAVTNIVNALVEAIIMPIINSLIGNASVEDLTVSVGVAELQVGIFLQAIIDFLIIALVLFLILRAVTKVMPKKEEEAVTKECPYCKSIIPITATRCPNCTSELEVEVEQA